MTARRANRDRQMEYRANERGEAKWSAITYKHRSSSVRLRKSPSRSTLPRCDALIARIRALFFLAASSQGLHSLFADSLFRVSRLLRAISEHLIIGIFIFKLVVASREVVSTREYQSENESSLLIGAVFSRLSAKSGLSAGSG